MTTPPLQLGFTELDVTWMKEAMDDNAYQGTPDKTYAFYLSSKNTPINRGKFKALLTAHMVRLAVPKRLKKVEVERLVKKHF